MALPMSDLANQVNLPDKSIVLEMIDDLHDCNGLDTALNTLLDKSATMLGNLIDLAHAQSAKLEALTDELFKHNDDGENPGCHICYRCKKNSTEAIHDICEACLVKSIEERAAAKKLVADQQMDLVKLRASSSALAEIYLECALMQKRAKDVIVSNMLPNSHHVQYDSASHLPCNIARYILEG